MRRELRSLPGAGWQYRKAGVQRETEEEREKAALRGSREDGVNHFSLYEKATELLCYSLRGFVSTHTHTRTLYCLSKTIKISD